MQHNHWPRCLLRCFSSSSALSAQRLLGGASASASCTSYTLAPVHKIYKCPRSDVRIDSREQADDPSDDASAPQMSSISQFFILSSRGDTIISKTCE